jgi:hypothetical protein
VPQRPPSFRPTVEALEDRCLLSLFAPFTAFPTGTDIESLAVGDFNGDGKHDLAVLHRDFSDNGTVSVLLGNGDGTFSAAPGGPIQVGLLTRSVAVGDFDGNGKADLVVANFGGPDPTRDGTLSVLLGNGDGTFTPAANSPLPAGSSASFVAVGDFDRNALPDLAVVNPSQNTVTVLGGNGDGTFTPIGFPVGVGNGPDFVAVGDFNGDGKPDLAVVNSNYGMGNGTVSVLLGNGTGDFFAQPITVPVGSLPTSVAVGDFDGNGTPDLAVTNSNDGTVSVLLGNGDGTFRPVANSPGPFGFGLPSVAVGDFNRDGKPDLAVANQGDNTVSVLLGNGDGTFTPDPNSPYRVANVPLVVTVADFNQDGAPDLAIASAFGGVDVLLNQTPVTATTVTSNANPVVAGQPVTFTATVTQAVPGPFAPTGLVNFFVDGQPAGAATLDATGHARWSTFTLGTGNDTITAAYVGNSHFSRSSSAALEQLVNQDGTTTALTASAGPVLAGQPLTLTATVTPVVPGFGSPTGTVLFLDGSATIGSGTLSDGAATFTTSALAPGGFGNFPPHGLTAVYVGDSNFTGSTSPVLPEVVNPPTPVLTRLSPSTVPEGSGAFTLTLTGSNFLGGAAVLWNGTPLRTVTAVSSTQIQVTVPAALVGDEGTANVTVTNFFSNPFSVVSSLPQTFTVTDAALTARGVNLSAVSKTTFPATGTLATFTDGNPGATAGDFTALIVWDDGTANFGTVTGTGPNNTGPFTVTAGKSHLFGSFTNAHIITVTIFDKGGTTVTVTDNVTDPPPPGGQAPTSASDPAAVPAVLPMDELFAALEAAMRARRHHHGHATGGQHPGHHHGHATGEHHTGNHHAQAHRPVGGNG